jgi:hypothetical protein
MTLAVEVMMITASTSMKLPNVSWPIESENDLGVVEFGGDSEVMVIEAGLQSGRNIRCIPVRWERADGTGERTKLARRPLRCRMP